MKLIGISSSTGATQTYLNTSYHTAFLRSGIAPVALPQFPIVNRETITQEEYNEQHKEWIDGFVEGLSGLVCSGGVDLSPISFDEHNWGSSNCDSERDMMELALLAAFMEANKPILGICRGHQAIGRVLGLSGFTQDLATSKVGEFHVGSEKELKDRQEPAHSIYALGAFREYMRQKTGRANLTELNVNSFHHQSFIFNDGKMPKHIETHADYMGWLQGRANVYGAKHDIDIIACTGRVVEGFEKPDAKIVSYQYHVEEYGNQGLAIAYWLNKYVNV